MKCCRPIIKPKYKPASAQFSLVTSPSSGENISLVEAWNYGSGIVLSNDTTITLSAGKLYEISYVFLATTEAGNYFEILPYINGTPRLLYAAMGTAGNNRNASTSASFLIREAADAEAILSLNITYPESIRNIDLSGVVTVQSREIS